MKTNTLNIVIGTVVTSLFIATAHAAEDGYDDMSILYQKEMMKTMDANSDGKISKGEYLKMSARMAEKKFMMMDMNDDGALSDVEFSLGLGTNEH